MHDIRGQMAQGSGGAALNINYRGADTNGAAIAIPSTRLYTPETAVRLHYPDEVDSRHPVGENPPAGAIIDYVLPAAPAGELTLDIIDRDGKGDDHGVDRKVVVEEARTAGFKLISTYDFVKPDREDYFLVLQPVQ